MSNVSVTNTFVSATVISSSAMNQNFSDLVNYINLRNAGSSAWDVLSVTGASTLTGNVSVGGTLAVTGATTLTAALSVGTTLGVTGLTTLANLTYAGTTLVGLSGIDGWTNANETWTYASSTTFTVAADVTAKYQPGDRLKCTNTTTKYFYVISAAYSAPNTTVTVTGGTDYTLANAAITANYFSHGGKPFGFPMWFSYTPTYGGSGSMTFGTVTTNVAKFAINGNSLQVVISSNGTTGGTASNTITATCPVTPGTASAAFYRTGCVVIDASDLMAGCMFTESGKISFRLGDSTNFGLGANHLVTGTMTYFF